MRACDALADITEDWEALATKCGASSMRACDALARITNARNDDLYHDYGSLCGYRLDPHAKQPQTCLDQFPDHT